MTRADAERELSYALEQVRRGEWRPPVEQVAIRETPTFHEAASEWFDAKRAEGGRQGRA